MLQSDEPDPNTGKPKSVGAAQPNSKANGGPGLHDLAVKGWASPLAIFVTALLVIESLTGLWIYLAPFSVSSQMQVLVHTIAGLVLLGPYVYFQTRHLMVWFRQKFTVVMVLGYALMATVVPCAVSGVVLTWESAAGPGRTGEWVLIHLVTGIAAFVLLAVHLILAYFRRRAIAARMPELRVALRRFVMGNLGWIGSCTVLVLALSLAWPTPDVEFPVPEDYERSEYVEQFDEYRGNPFAPTYARTESGMFVHSDVLSHSESCGSSRCHEQILDEWQPSAHRFSAMNPPFQRVQKNFAVDRGVPETRYCAGCHDPISLFAGAKDIHNQDLAAPGMQEGVSCVVCHSMSKVDQRGNADYVLTPPRKYIWESTGGWRKYVSDFLIRAYPRQHLVDYDRNLLRTPEFCAACHKQFIPEALNRFGLSPGQNQYDEWRKSHWHVDDPDQDLSCRDCHMRLVFDSRDPGRGEDGDTRRRPDDGAHRHHGAIATNFLMPEVLKLDHWQEQVRLTEQWIRGETVLPEIADLWPPGPVMSLQLAVPKEVRAGEQLALRAFVGNRKAGHNFTTGPLDFMRAWIHLRVLDADQNTIAEWGNIDPQTRRIQDYPGRDHKIGNPRNEGTMVFEAQPLDAEGNALLKHELWKKAGGEGQRVIFPGYRDSQIYRLTVPAGTRGPLRVKADLNFRRYRQEFLDLTVPEMERDSGVIQGMVKQSSDEKQIRVVREVSLRRPYETKQRKER